MLIYLAELSHTGRGPMPRVVPLAVGYIAAATIKALPEARLKLFRDPQRLLSEVRRNHPDIVGFSVYHWSERLAAFCARKIKAEFPSVVTVAGGASIDDNDRSLESFLDQHPEFDFCIFGQGEIGFVNLARRYLDNGPSQNHLKIGGCSFLAPDGSLVKGEYILPDLSELPSPYLEGFLDEFLVNGYEPIIQTMRGCPYGCTYCVSGSRLWNKIRAFSLEEVYAELDYIRAMTTSDKLIVADENVGILGQRDVSVAERIMSMHHDEGYPKRLYHYSAKVITGHVKTITKLLAPIGQFSMSFQTLDESVRREIARVSVSWEMFEDYLAWARRHGVVSVTELIFGLPGETANGYISGMERLLRSGVDRVYSYNLRLLSGTDLAKSETRQKYGFATAFRATEGGFGIYDGEVVSEAEEVVVGSTSFDETDYFTVRKYGLFLELAVGRGYLSDLINIAKKIGLPSEKIIRHLARETFAGRPLLQRTIQEYEQRARNELFNSPDDCEAYINNMILSGKEVVETKLNLIFTGKIILDDKIRRELLDVIKEFIFDSNSDRTVRDLIVDYIDNVLEPSIVRFVADEPDRLESKTRVPVENLLEHSLEQNLVIRERETLLKMTLPEDYKRHRKDLIIDSDCSEAGLQKIYMTVGRFGLLRKVEVFGQ